MKRFLKISGLIFGAIVLLLAAVLIFIDTSAGHKLLRNVAVDVLNERVLTGRVEIDAIEGSLYGDLRIRGIRVFDAAGQEAVRLDGFRLAYDLGALFGGVVRVDAIELERPFVAAIVDGHGALNLAGLVRTSTPAVEEEPEGDEEPPSLQVELARFALTGGGLRFSQPSSATEISGLDIVVTATVAGPVIDAAIRRFVFAVSEPRIDVDLRADVRWSGDSLAADLALSAGSARVVLDKLRFALSDQTAQGKLQIILPARLWSELALDPALLADLNLSLELSPGDKEQPWKISGAGDLSGGKIGIDVLAGASGGKIGLKLSEIDPSRLHAAAPYGAMNLNVAAELPRWDTGTVAVFTAGNLGLDGQSWNLDGLKVSADFSPEAAKAHAELALSGSREAPAKLSLKRTKAAARGSKSGSLLATVDAELALLPAPSLTVGRVKLSADELSAVAPRGVPVRGGLQVDATARGPFDALAADVEVRGATLAFDAISLGALSLKVNASGIPSAIAADVEMDARRLDTPGLRLSEIRMGARARDAGKVVAVELAASGPDFVRKIGLAATATITETIQVSLRELSLDTPAPVGSVAHKGSRSAQGGVVAWRSKPARLVLADSIRVDGFELSSSAGTISADGAIDPALFPATASDLRVKIAALDLAAFTPLAPQIGKVSGLVDLDARLAAIEGAATASVSLAVSDLKRDAAGPLFLRTAVNLAGPSVNGTLAIEGPTIGAVNVKAEGVAPVKILDPAAWAGSGSLTSVNGALEKLSLAGLVAFTGTTAQLAGTIDGTFGATARGETIDLALTARGVSAPALALPAGAEITLAARRENIAGNIVAIFKGSPVMKVKVDSTAGTDAYRKYGIQALEQKGAKLLVDAENVPAALIAELARLDPKDPRFAAPQGYVSLQLGAGAARGVADLEIGARIAARGLAFAEKAPPLDLTVTATLARGEARAVVDAVFARHGELHLEAEADVGTMDAEVLKKRGLDVVTGVRGDISGLRLKLAQKWALAADVPDGGFFARFDLKKGLSSGTIDLALQDLSANPKIAPIDLHAYAALAPSKQTFTATVSIDTRTLLTLNSRLDASLAEITGGKLNDAPLAVTVRSKEFQLRRAFDDAQLSKMIAGKLSLEALVRGTISKPSVVAEVAIEDALLGGAPFGVFAAAVNYSGDAAKVSFEAQGKGSFTARADVTKLSSAPELVADIEADQFDLQFVGPLAKAAAGAALGLDGKLVGKITARGPLSAPKPNGTMKIEGLRAILPGAPPLAKSGLELSIDPSKINLALKGEMGGGELTVDFAAIRGADETISLDGLITTKSVKVSAGQQVAAINSEVRLKGEKRGPDLKAEVSIGPVLVALPAQKSRKLRVIEEFEDLELVSSFENLVPAIAKTAVAAEEKDGGKLDVAIKTPEPIVIRGADADLWVDVDLALKGEGTRRRMTGDVEVERGRLSILGRTYNFRRGRVLFDGPFPPDPRLDIEIAHDFESLTLMVIVSGTGKKPKIRFASDPGGHDQSELMSFFVGVAPGEGSAGKAAGGLLASQIPGAARDSLPIDTVDLDLGEGGKGGSVTTGKWITDDVFVAYMRRFQAKGAENEDEGVVRWHFARGWTLETRFGSRNLGLETTWVKRY